MIIPDVNGIPMEGYEADALTTPNGSRQAFELKRPACKFIGPALGGGSNYYAIRKPKSHEEFNASYRRAFRN